MQRGNRESTVQRKLKYLKALKGSPQEMIQQILSSPWVDKSKNNALDVVCQYSEFLGSPIAKPRFRAYDNREMFIPSPEMVKQFLFRVRNIALRTMIKIAIETGSSSGEVFNLRWKDVNLQSKTIIITGIKGHRTSTYPISEELIVLLGQIPRGRR